MKKKKREQIVSVTAGKPTKCGNTFSEETLKMIHENNMTVTKYDKDTKTLSVSKRLLYLLINGLPNIEKFEK
ncbi:MAG: hypothetical protein PHX51_08450 [Clostridia bacterium]|nr:hypothetical protein [Clostridia bacterium]